MIHLTRYGRRMRLTMISALSAACFVCLFAIPFVGKKLLKNEVGYYSIVIDGAVVGSANSKEDAQQALADARLKFSRDYTSVIYLDPDIEIEKQSRTIATRMSEPELEASIYSNLFSSIVNIDKNVAYTVKIKDYAVTLASKNDVISLMEKITAKYDVDHDFQISLVADSSTEGTYSVDLQKVDNKKADTDIVSKALNGSADTSNGNATNTGLTGVSFGQPVEVCETSAVGAGIASVQEAYDAITKTSDVKQTYTVQAGDTLASIAQSHSTTIEQIQALNRTLTASTILVPGDGIVIAVPTAQLSVVTTKRTTYEEDYHALPQYVDNNTTNKGNYTVTSQGTTGHRKVTADVTYVNGVQTAVNYVEQEVATEAKPDVISVGTLAGPGYIRPVSGGPVSSAYGERDGKFYNGVEWSVPVQTAVNAAAAGRITRAGWYSNYGYCVDITHQDGSMTRYGYLSSITVAVGQNVNQGQLIAYSGSTGECSEAGLRFELWIGGTTVNPVNYVNKN